MHLFHGRDGFQQNTASIVSSDESKEELNKQYYIYKYNANLERNQLFFNFYRNATWFLDRYGDKYDKELKTAKESSVKFFLNHLKDIKINLSEETKDTEWIESVLLPIKKKVITSSVPAHFTLQHVEFIRKFPGVKNIDLTYPRYAAMHSTDPHAIGRRNLFIECIEESNVGSVLASLAELELADGNQILKLNPEKMDPVLQIMDALDVLDTPERRRIDLINVIKVAIYADKMYGVDGWLKVKDHLLDLSIDVDTVADLKDEQVQQGLDIIITYLRLGHLIEFYGGCVQATSLYHLLSFKKDVTVRGRRSFKEQDEQFLKRATIMKQTNENQQDEQHQEEVELEDEEALKLPSERQIGLFDDKIEYFLTVKDLKNPKDQYFGKQVDGEIVKKTRDFIEVGEDRFTCKCCIKVFNAEHFTRKHIKNKHANQFDDLVQETKLFNLYASDAFRLKWRNTENIRKRKYVDHDRTNLQIATITSFE